MIERWSRDQVLALAPDASSQKAAQGLSSPAKWLVRGMSGEVLFGECKGSGAKPYQSCVDLSEPAYRCSCPSRKFPCKHCLGLLLSWSADGVPDLAVPPWAAEWIDQRAARAAKAEARVEAARAAASAEPGGSGAVPSGARAEQASGRPDTRTVRQARVAAGLSELERWLGDQVRHGLAGADPADWQGLAKRLVDAQAPGVASIASRLARVPGQEGWPARLLEEYALLKLLVVAYTRRAELPAPLAQTVLQRVGFPVAREDVLAGQPVRDEWDVIGTRDEEVDRLLTRRVWLRGRASGRAAVVLSFAPPGQPLDASLVAGTAVEADLAFYPGAAPLRALVAVRHRMAEPHTAAPPGLTPDAALDELAAAIAGDPWVDSWPLLLSGVVPGSAQVGGLPLHPRHRDPWRLLAVSGGHPVTMSAEWTPQGLRPLMTWDEGRAVLL
ncbi:SWIM zinc finger family protein [Nonomuraea sp. NPDC050328]|uniref:SWIM zinc finger family protein n=1 Tax=Nonomuraea sp. NPDC050328 TaxID=3364361 RepID=UPI00378D270A